MTSREYGRQENTNVVLNMATEKLYGAARIPDKIIIYFRQFEKVVCSTRCDNKPVYVSCN